MAYINGKKVLGVVRTVGTGTGELPTNPEFESVIVGDTNIESNNINMGDQLAIGRHTDGTGGYIYVEDGSADNCSEITPTKVETPSVIVGNTQILNNEIYMGDPLLIGRNENGGYVITEEVGGTDKAKMTPTKISVENDEGYSEITPYEVSNNYADRTVRFCAEEDVIEIIDKINDEYMHLRKDGISYKKNGTNYGFYFPITQGETLLVGRDLIDIKPNTILLNKINDNVIQQYDSYYKEKFNVYKFDNDRSEGSGYMDFGDAKVCTTINSKVRPIWNSGSGGNKQFAMLDDIQESLGLPINIATASAMDAVLVSANVGKVYKYIGTTTDKYTNGNLYLVEEE